MRLFLFSLCALVLVFQVNGAIMDFAKLIKSMRSSDSDPKFKYLGAFKDPKAYEIPHLALDEFRTYVDQIPFDDALISLEDNKEMSKELQQELDLIRKAVLEEHEEYDPAKMQKGQVPALECGEYGCCADGTKADRGGIDSCALKLCEDVFKTTCGAFSEKTRKAKCSSSFFQRKCPFTCDKCKPPATPIKACQSLYPASMCCWDGTPARGPNGIGCKQCKDIYKPVCKVFFKKQKVCNSNSWRIRTFMNRYCPGTCGFCSK